MAARKHHTEVVANLRAPVAHRWIVSGAALCLFAALAIGAAAPAGGASAAPSSGTIVFASERSGDSQIYSVHADGSRLGQLTRDHDSDTAPVFSPDGRRIVFARSTRCCSGLWLMNADGSGQRPLAADASEPAWSPDSRRIAYVGSGSSAPLVIADVARKSRIVIRGALFHPSWSRDGRWLAMTRQVGDRIDLAVVASAGGRPRTIWRNIDPYGLLGWTGRGEIVATTAHNIVVVPPDRKGAHRLPAVRRAEEIALSPDGRRIAWIAGLGRHLRVRSLAGGRTREITPRGIQYLNSVAWSADGRWLAVASLPRGGVFHDILVVAANGSSSRRITQRLPYPYGSENSQPSWRPRGATRARLGRRPVAALRSESFSHTRFEAPGGASISAMAADGGRAAMVINFANSQCAGVEVWDAQKARAFRVERPCGSEGASIREDTSGVALAGDRAAWLHTSGGNTTETDLVTATLELRKTVSVATGGLDDNGAGTTPRSPVGDGSLLAFTVDRHCDSSDGYPEDQCPAGKKTGDVVAATIWRIGGQGKCPYETPKSEGCSRVAEASGELTVLAVDAARIVARTDTGVELLTEQGSVLRNFAVKARGAALSGNRIALRTVAGVEVYDAGSGQLTQSVPLAAKGTLEDLEGDLLVTRANGTVTVRRLGDGRTASFRPGGAARAQLEQPGLFVGGAHRVTFTPMGALVRRLGG